MIGGAFATIPMQVILRGSSEDVRDIGDSEGKPLLGISFPLMLSRVPFTFR